MSTGIQSNGAHGMTRPTQSGVDWKRVAGAVWAAQSRADLNERPRLLLAWIIRGTVECGRTQLVVPDFGELFGEIKVAPPHRKAVSLALSQTNICTFERCADGWRVTLNVDASQWRCGWYHEADAKARWLARLNAMPGQCQGELLEPEPSLVTALAEVAVDQVAKRKAESGSYQVGNCGVTKLVTERVSLKERERYKPLSLEQGSKLQGADAAGLKGKVYAIEGEDEAAAMAGMSDIIGAETWRNDGGKWRNRWRADRAAVAEVFAAYVEELERQPVRSPGGYAEWLWKSLGRKR